MNVQKVSKAKVEPVAASVGRSDGADDAGEHPVRAAAPPMPAAAATMAERRLMAVAVRGAPASCTVRRPGSAGASDALRNPLLEAMAASSGQRGEHRAHQDAHGRSAQHAGDEQEGRVGPGDGRGEQDGDRQELPDVVRDAA